MKTGAYLFLVAVLCFVAVVLHRHLEHFSNPDEPVTNPNTVSNAIQTEWEAKINSQKPIDGDMAAYKTSVQKFYTDVYAPATVEPTEAAVKAFVTSEVARDPQLKEDALTRILMTGFKIDSVLTGAAREDSLVKLKDFKDLEPPGGRDQVYGRMTEGEYTPADSFDSVSGSGGQYANVPRQVEPINEKKNKWSNSGFASTCPCAENML